MSAKMFKFGVNVSHSLDDAFGLPHKVRKRHFCPLYIYY